MDLNELVLVVTREPGQRVRWRKPELHVARVGSRRTLCGKPYDRVVKGWAGFKFCQVCPSKEDKLVNQSVSDD